MKHIPEMQNKRYKRKSNITRRDRVTCRCYRCDNMETGLIDSSVDIAEEQRSALKPKCTAETCEGVRERRPEKTGPGRIKLSSQLSRVKPSKNKNVNNKKKVVFLVDMSLYFPENDVSRVSVYRSNGNILWKVQCGE